VSLFLLSPKGGFVQTPRTPLPTPLHIWIAVDLSLLIIAVYVDGVLRVQSQQDIEARINEILSKIAILQSAQQTAAQIAPAAKSAEAESAKYQKKLDELEAQLSRLTRDRLDYLEKLHQQQLEFQVLIYSVMQKFCFFHVTII